MIFVSTRALVLSDTLVAAFSLAACSDTNKEAKGDEGDAQGEAGLIGECRAVTARMQPPAIVDVDVAPGGRALLGAQRGPFK